MNIGDRIREARKTKGLSQDDLAKMTGISRVTLGFYERNQNVPPTDTLGEIAKALDADALYLIYGTQPEQLERASESIRRFTAKAAETALLSSFHKLNDDGKERLVEDAEMLAENPRFQDAEAIAEQEAEPQKKRSIRVK